MPDTSLPSFVEWASFPFEGSFRVKELADPVAVEPPRMGEDKAGCAKCQAPDSDYIWVNENWRVRSMDRPSGLPMVLILESRSHLDLGDLPNMLAAELGVMTVRLERAVRSLDGVARVHVNRWGDGAAHLHLWFMARPQGRLQLRGTFLTMWEGILPPMPEQKWQENLALVAAWLAEFGGQPLAQPPRIEWKAPSSLEQLGPNLTYDFELDPSDDPATSASADQASAAESGNPGSGNPEVSRSPEPRRPADNQPESGQVQAGHPGASDPGSRHPARNQAEAGPRPGVTGSHERPGSRGGSEVPAGSQDAGSAEVNGERSGGAADRTGGRAAVSGEPTAASAG